MWCSWSCTLGGGEISEEPGLQGAAGRGSLEGPWTGTPEFLGEGVPPSVTLKSSMILRINPEAERPLFCDPRQVSPILWATASSQCLSQSMAGKVT